MLWVSRQFFDGFVQYPVRFSFKDISTGDILYVYDLELEPGKILETGTPIHRGYFQPIEDFLGQYSLDELREILNAAGLSIARLNEEINNTNQILSLYAPLSGAIFTNPKSKESPPATNNSTRVSTTEYIRKYIAQYPFPSKNVKDLISNTFVIDNITYMSVGWYNPVDFVYDGMTLSQWESTRLVYRSDRYPNNENDGTILAVDYQRPERTSYSEFYPEPGSYYFQLFPLGTNGIWNRNISNRAFLRISGMTSWSGLSQARHNLASSTDGNGYVLFGGGQTGATNSSIVDKFDLNGNRTTLNLSVASSNLAASTDGNGYVLFSVRYGSVDKFDLNGNRTTLSLSQARDNLAASTDGNGRVYFGGGNLLDDTVDRFDLNGNRTILNLSVSRELLAASTDGNGRVLFGGGSNRLYDIWYRAVDKFDLNGNRTYLELRGARDNLTASTNGNGHVMFGGGRWFNDDWAEYYVDKFDLNGNRTDFQLSIPRFNLTSSTDRNGHVLFGGGYGGWASYDQLDTVDKFDLNNNRITLNLNQARNRLASSTLGNGNVLFGGGYTGAASSLIIDEWYPE